jgi:ABC-2 type transport system permease protein
MIALTAYFPILLVRLGNPDVGPMLSGYLGYLLLGACLLAVGVFASSVTQNQIVAAVIGMGITLLLWLSGALQELVGPTMGKVVAYIPIFGHYLDMVRGVVDTTDVVYYVTLIALFLFLSTRVIESGRWK